MNAGCNTSYSGASVCSNLNIDGYSDWFLPSFDELRELHSVLVVQEGIGGFVIGDNSNDEWYLSSSEVQHMYPGMAYAAWCVRFHDGFTYDISKHATVNVRPIRSVTIINGCTDSIALNYNANANKDKGRCGNAGCNKSTAV